VIIAGVRVATIAGIGIAVIAAVIGAGGLGRLVFDGIRLRDADIIVAGAVMATLLALIADWGFARIAEVLRRDLRPSMGGR